jgi:hypothetical protein
MDAQSLIVELAARGIRLIPNPPKLIAVPAAKLTDEDCEAIRRHKAGLLALLVAQQEQADTERIVRLDAERHEADRHARRADVLDSATETESLNRPVCPACRGRDLRVSPAGGLVCQGCGRFLFLHAELGAGAPAYPALPLRRCGSLVCRDCHAHNPGPHREGCRAPSFEPCRSRWFWLSPYRAIKCVACANPADLALVEAWILARETGEGDDGWRIPSEILMLLHVEAPMQ